MSHTPIEDKNIIDGLTLIEATKQKNLNVIIQLLLNGGDVNQVDQNGATPLIHAVLYGKFEIIRECLQSDEDKPTNSWDLFNQGHLRIFRVLQRRAALEELPGNTEQPRYFDIAKELIKHGADSNKVDKYGWSVLLYATYCGLSEVVRELLQNGADITIGTYQDKTALDYAKLFGFSDIGHELLTVRTHKCSTGFENNRSFTKNPIESSAQSGNLNLVIKCLRHGYDVNSVDGNGWPPLIYASCFGYFKIVRKLVQAGADINKASTRGSTSLMQAAGNGHLKIVKTLLKNGAEVNKVDRSIHTALIYGVLGGHLEVVQELLQNNADVTIKSFDGKTALDLAKKFGFSGLEGEVAKVKIGRWFGDLFAHKPNPEDDSLLVEASKLGNVELLMKLLKKGANVNAIDKKGWTPLLWASWYGHTETVKELLNKGAYFNKTGPFGRTALINAVICGYWYTVGELVNYGADVNKRDAIGWTALMYASCYGDLRMVDELLKFRAKVNVVGVRGETALIKAACHGHLEIVGKLLDNQNNKGINMVDRDGWSGLMYAVFCRRLPVVRELLRRGADKMIEAQNGLTGMKLALKMNCPDIVNELGIK